MVNACALLKQRTEAVKFAQRQIGCVQIHSPVTCSAPIGCLIKKISYLLQLN